MATATEYRKQKQAEKIARIQKQKDDIYNQIHILKGLVLWLPTESTADQIEILCDLDILKQKIFEVGS